MGRSKFKHHPIMRWLRKVVPDLFLAALIALLITLAMNQLDDVETLRIKAEKQAAAADGLTLDERIGVLADSMKRSTLFHLPSLIALGGVVAGFACRNRRWAWLTAAGSVLPALVMGCAFFIDRFAAAALLVAGYVGLAVATSVAGTTLRQKIFAWMAPPETGITEDVDSTHESDG
jgi:hypothetical protein